MFLVDFERSSPMMMDEIKCVYQFQVKFEGQTRLIHHKLADVNGEIK